MTRRSPRARRFAAAGVLAIATALAGCTTPLEIGERRYREGDRLAALDTWRAIPADSLYYDAAQKRITEVENEFDQLVVRYKQRARYYERKERLAESILNWRLAGKLAPDDTEIVNHVQELSRTLAARKTEAESAYAADFGRRDFAAARRDLEQRRTLDPFDPKLEADSRVFEEALRGEVDDLLARGRAAYAAQRYAEANAAFRKVLTIEPENESAQGFLSYSRMARGEPERPSPHGGATTPRAPAPVPALTPVTVTDAQIRAEGFYQNALAAERNGDPYAAIRQDQRALQSDPGHAGARRHLATLREKLSPEVEGLIESGRSSFRQEDLQGALDQWRRALLVDPGNTRAKEYEARAEKLLDNLEQLRAEPEAGGGSR